MSHIIASSQPPPSWNSRGTRIKDREIFATADTLQPELGKRYTQQTHSQQQSQVSWLWTLCSSETKSFQKNTPGRFDSASLLYLLQLKNTKVYYGALAMILWRFLVKTWKKKKVKENFLYQQRLSHCQWWRWLQHRCQPQNCPGPVLPPSSVHHTEHSEPLVGSTGWSPHFSPHLAFPPKYTHIDHLQTKKFNINDWKILRLTNSLKPHPES